MIKVYGIFMTLFGVFLLLSCISYLLSSKNDEVLIEADSSSGAKYQNWMGSLGAHTAWFFMKNYFGIGAIFIPLMAFVWGVRIWLKRDILPFWKTIRLSTLGMLFFPSLIAFIFHNTVNGTNNIELTCNSILVGSVGMFLCESGIQMIGWTGSLLVFVFTLIVFAIFNFNHQMEALWARLWEWLKSLFTAKPVDEEPVEAQPEVAQEKAPPAVNTWKEEEKKTPIAAVIEEEEVPWEDTPSDNHIIPIEPIEEEEEEDVVEEEPEVTFQDDEAVDIPPVMPTGQVVQLDDDFLVEVEQGEDELSEEDIQRKIEDLGPYDPRLDLSRYTFPSIDLLKPHGGQGPQINKEELEENKNKIVETLNHYKIEISKIKASIGPTVTLYEIIPAPGVRISKIKNLEDDIALSLAALGIRIIAPIPGKGTIGIEVPNSKPDVVSMRSLIASEKFQNTDMELPVVLGKTISNENFVVDLAKMPHLLMAGATGQGKSVGLNAILVSLLYKKHPAEIKFVLVDPKKVELTLFNKIERHFLAKLPNEADPIITDVQKVVKTLNSLCIEMDTRYELLKTAECRNIIEYNKKFTSRRLNPENGHRYLPYIVLVVDEFADLIMTAGREVETPIARLAQLARAIGIHLIIATQRPSVNIITGTIKANFPARIAFRVTSKIDSRTILDTGGAEQLIGRGDMLYSTGNDLIRLQCGFVDTPEVKDITDYIGAQQGYSNAFLLPEVADENSLEMGNFADEDRDELFEEAARIVVMTQQGSASLLQRKLKLGYNRAGR
ncbi:MAG: DNA translocase FtsK 4TM domain-containing protein, partial [Flavobacteriales bacterium]